jgi:hypothetical protein
MQTTRVVDSKIYDIILLICDAVDDSAHKALFIIQFQ